MFLVFGFLRFLDLHFDLRLLRLFAIFENQLIKKYISYGVITSEIIFLL